jgi:hypothetical protein
MQRDVERAEKADREDDSWQDGRPNQGTQNDDGKPKP